jgi:beta-phosphoglucomutase
MRWLAELRRAGVRTAIGSSSRNASTILARIGLADAFDVVIDGSRISRSKPDPEVFLLASGVLDVPPHRCLVVEDANAGVDAALAAGMHVIAIGAAAGHRKADISARSLVDLDPQSALESLETAERGRAQVSIAGSTGRPASVEDVTHHDPA